MIFGIDSEGDNCGIRRKPTERMMRSSNIVHAAAEYGPAKRSEFDHVGSGFEKYGARISHTLKICHQLVPLQNPGTRQLTSSRPKSEVKSNLCSFG
jgi:hypothetical protein